MKLLSRCAGSTRAPPGGRVVLADRTLESMRRKDAGSQAIEVGQNPVTPYRGRRSAIVAIAVPPSSASVHPTPAEELFAKVRLLLEKMDTPKTDAEVAAELNVSKSQVKEWLQRLVKEGVLEKMSKPVRYCSTKASGRLF